MANKEYDEQQLKKIGKIYADTKWTPVQKKHLESLCKDYRFEGVKFFNGHENPLGIPTSFVSQLSAPIPKHKLWWVASFKERDENYIENCEVFERLTGRQVKKLDKPPTTDMLDVYRTLKKPVFLARPDALVQGVVDIFLGKRISGPLTNAKSFLDVSRGCIETQKAPHGGSTSRSGRVKSGYISFRCDKLDDDIPLTHALIAIVYGVEALLPIYTGAYEVSHRCHNSLCANMDHLLIETSYSNRKMREGCQGFSGHECRCGPVKCAARGVYTLDDYRTETIISGTKSVQVKIPPFEGLNCLQVAPKVEEWLKLLDIRCTRKHIQPITVDPSKRYTGRGKCK